MAVTSTARAQAARLVEARKRLMARQNTSKEDGMLAPLRTAVAEAEQQERQAISDYEAALNAFYKQRAGTKRQLEQLTERRTALMKEIPAGTRQIYSDLVDRGVRDPVVARHDGRCGVCSSTDTSGHSAAPTSGGAR